MLGEVHVNGEGLVYQPTAYRSGECSTDSGYCDESATCNATWHDELNMCKRLVGCCYFV